MRSSIRSAGMRGKRVGLLSKAEILKATAPASISGTISDVSCPGTMVP